MIACGYIRACRLAASLLLIQAAAFSADIVSPDIAYREHHKIKFNDRSYYQLQSEVQISLTCLSEHGTEGNVFFVPDYEGAKVDKFKARVNGDKLGGRYVGNFLPKRRDEFFSELRIWGISYPDLVKVGDTLSYEYKVEYSSPAELNILEIPNLNFVERYSVEMELPSDVEVDIEWYFPADSVPIRAYRESETRFVLFADSLAERKTLPSSDYSKVHARGLVTFRRGSEVLTPSTAEAFTEWYLGLQGMVREIAPDCEPDVLPGISRAPDELAAVEMIHDFVRQNIRYIADVSPHHTIVPYPPAEVLAKRYGDCKDRAMLVSALAARHGITVHPCLVSRLPTREFEGLHYHLFNHVICMLETTEGPVYFDPTPRNYPMGTLPYQEVGHYGLVLDTANPRVVEYWPRDTLPVLEVHLEGSIDSLENVRARIIARAGYRSEILEARSNYTDYEFRQFLSSRLPKYLFRIELDEFEILPDSDPETRMTARANLTGFVVSSASRVYLPKNPFITIDRETMERADDSWPIVAGYPRGYHVTLNLSAPGYDMAEDSLRLSAQAVAHLTSDLTTTEDGSVRADYTFRLRKAVVQGEERRAFMDFCRQCLDSRRDMYQLERGSKP